MENKLNNKSTYYEKDKLKYKSIIDGAISSKSGSDLKSLLNDLHAFRWRDEGRKMFLLGLLQGALFQFKKDVSIEELKTYFYDL